MLPSDHKERKDTPIVTGVVDYFPLALAEIARVSKAGNDQHNPGQPLHWAKGKSTDHADSLMRHLIERGTMDVDGQRHSAKVAWRALALLQTELEEQNVHPRNPNSITSVWDYADSFRVQTAPLDESRVYAPFYQQHDIDVS